MPERAFQQEYERAVDELTRTLERWETATAWNASEDIKKQITFLETEVKALRKLVASMRHWSQKD